MEDIQLLEARCIGVLNPLHVFKCQYLTDRASCLDAVTTVSHWLRSQLLVTIDLMNTENRDGYALQRWILESSPNTEEAWNSRPLTRQSQRFMD